MEWRGREERFEAREPFVKLLFFLFLLLGAFREESTRDDVLSFFLSSVYVPFVDLSLLLFANVYLIYSGGFSFFRGNLNGPRWYGFVYTFVYVGLI